MYSLSSVKALSIEEHIHPLWQKLVNDERILEEEREPDWASLVREIVTLQGGHTASTSDPDNGLISTLDVRLRAIYCYWNFLRGNALCPARERFSPAAVTFALGRVNMLDVHRNQDGKEYRFLYRLFGSNMAVIEGRDLTGHWVDETTNPEYMSMLEDHYSHAVEHCEATLYEIKGVFDRKRYDYQRVILPFCSGQPVVTHLLVCSFPNHNINPDDT
ncbi:PAS domain-containing protein [Kiloniella sp. b19]|uniref:PAS domain-containing protein n=1 Tax=Kiloniella sp. GXU_MW_B19 TaxID=3141326 RepID=UPI0031DA6173